MNDDESAEALKSLEAAAMPICITHKPGHMLITDVPEDAEVPILRPKTLETV